MTSDRIFYQQLKHRLELETVVLATIVKVLGSAPREIGAKMAICQDGSIIGTIGGGAGEAKVITQALKVLKTGEKQLVEIDLTGTPGKDIQGVCGGKVQVWLEKWSSSAIALIEEILELLKTGQSVKLVTPFTQDVPPYLMRYPDSPQKITNSLYFSATSVKTNSRSPLTFTPSASCDRFVETIEPQPILLIIGGGHVAVSISQIANFAGFQIVVQDDRPEFITPQRFPQALFLSQSITETLNTLTTHSLLYVALVTRGYPQDIEALKALLQYPISYQYIGAIGSQKRIRMIKQAIPIARLPNFYAPIGLDIGALTPEEIAISICGELIKVRRGGTGLSLGERMQQCQTPSKVHLSHISV
ncbi:Xanthine and CO dehydrogenases maturation factor, XdhC/CoxF family [Hyella patelloides LEGE 07179]|uniref:Xanthine and CO dehydrogenases maturation factor, XdhC/CoxF family n=1 Tax=Hyella patelloides LEGE 07179 TaxID=945734 RepID=A0A563VLP4_9CYAN|nr:XdhC/CoxI family protein [Hyella patelloides]VEP12277.1 Xanthine and CO dehydrogenases maturation factor, XdhC/CoxF family [Hyella patelloides LEGE 07179]